MTAKQELFDRLQYLKAATDLPEIIDQGIAPSPHNGVANLLRKGLGIVAFNILEDYIKNRSNEALNVLSNSTVAFSRLPESLQAASITGALNALTFKSKLLKKDGGDWKLLVQDEALKIHSTKQAVFELSSYSFFSASSNIGETEISDLLKAFGIAGGWTQLKSVADSVNGGLPDLSQTYRNAAARRHSSAHSASFRYDYQWLLEIKNEILAIAASLDVLLCARCRQIAANPGKKVEDHDITAALKYRFLEKVGTQYRETVTIGGRAKKRWIDKEQALNALNPQLVANSEFLILLDDAKRIEDWRT